MAALARALAVPLALLLALGNFVMQAPPPQPQAQVAYLEEYNGYTNRETWVTNLWITSYESLYDTCREIAERNDSTVSGTLYTLFQRLNLERKLGRKEWGTADKPWDKVPLDTMFSDIGGAKGLEKVNWDEIAEYLQEK